MNLIVSISRDKIHRNTYYVNMIFVRLEFTNTIQPILC